MGQGTVSVLTSTRVVVRPPKMSVVQSGKSRRCTEDTAPVGPPPPKSTGKTPEVAHVTGSRTPPPTSSWTPMPWVSAEFNIVSIRSL